MPMMFAFEALAPELLGAEVLGAEAIGTALGAEALMGLGAEALGAGAVGGAEAAIGAEAMAADAAAGGAGAGQAGINAAQVAAQQSAAQGINAIPQAMSPVQQAYQTAANVTTSPVSGFQPAPGFEGVTSGAQGASPNFFNPSAAPGQGPMQYQLSTPNASQGLRLGTGLESIGPSGPITSVLQPPSALEAGMDKAMEFAKKNPFTAMTGAYMGANALGLLNPSGATFNNTPYDGPLSKYKLAPNFQGSFANPANFQYNPATNRRYASGGGIMGAESYDIPVGYDEGGPVTEAQKDAAKRAFELANPNGLGPSVNVGGYGTLNFQNDAAYDQFNQNPQSMTFSQGPGGVRYVEPQAADYNSMGGGMGMGMGGGGSGKPGFDEQGNATMAFAKGGSLSESIEQYQKMLGGQQQAAPARSADVGIYYDQDPDTRYQDALTAAQIRQAKVNQRAYVSPPAAKRPMPMGKLDMPTSAKSKGGGDVEAAAGGIMHSSLGGYAAGGNPRLLKGPGDGMSDNIPATINGRQPARLADGEFVIPADVVSHLGNGSTEAGAKHLHAMMNKVRKARTGNPKQGKQINAKKYMPK